MDTQGNDMVSAKFVAICGALMALITLSVGPALAAASMMISAYNMRFRSNDLTYIVSMGLLLLIAIRAAWLIQCLPST